MKLVIFNPSYLPRINDVVKRGTTMLQLSDGNFSESSVVSGLRYSRCCYEDIMSLLSTAKCPDWFFPADVRHLKPLLGIRVLVLQCANYYDCESRHIERIEMDFYNDCSLRTPSLFCGSVNVIMH